MKVGRLYFAMVDAGDVFDPDVHNVEDLVVFDLKISQSEGEFARAQLEIPNPGIGLLSSTRKQYLFISCDFNGNVEPLFAGRVIGFPTDFGADVITVEYIAQSVNWAATQQAFLDTLKVAPYYNVLFTDTGKRDDPVEILATRNALLHWDRLPGGGVSLSDIIEGSTTIDLSGDYLFDSLKTSIGDPPLKTVSGKVEVQWIQTGTGEVDVGTKIKNEFVNTGGAPSPKINSLTPLSWEAAWKGATIPSGYTVKQSVLTPTISGVGAAFLKSPAANVSSSFFPTKDGGVGIITRATHVPRVFYNGILKLTANYAQKRREVMSFSLDAVTQEFSLSADTNEDISFTLQDPTADAQNNILNPNEPTFFYDAVTHVPTAYGTEVIENILLRARARLMKAARVVEASFESAISSLDILNLNCDQSIHIEDDRLPGGKMRGKVLGYSLHFSDQDQLAEATIGSIIGTGVDTSGSGTSLGSVTYDNEDTISIDADMESVVIYDVVGVASPSIPIDVGDLQTDPFYCVTSVLVTDAGQSQNNAFAAQTRPDTYLNANGTAAEVDLLSMNPTEELLLEFTLTTSPMTLPQHIDLEAS